MTRGTLGRCLLALLTGTIAGCNVSFDSCLSLPTNQSPGPGKLGVGFTVDADDEVNQTELAMTSLEEIGVTAARVPVSWKRIQPSRDNVNWRGLDFLIESAKRHHVTLHAVLQDTPDWASSSPFLSATGNAMAAPLNIEDWYRFVLLLANRVQADIKTFEIGHDIDQRTGWNGTPEQYARLVVGASRILKSLNPQARIVLGSVTFGENRESEFLDQVLQDRQDPVDRAVDAVGLYPDAATPGQIRERLFALRRALTRRSIDKPIIITGIAWSADTVRQASCQQYQGGESGQAEYVRETMPWLLTLGVERVFWGYLWDGKPDEPSATWGLIDRQLQERAAFGALAGLIDPSRVGKAVSDPGSDSAASDVPASPAPNPASSPSAAPSSRP